MAGEGRKLAKVLSVLLFICSAQAEKTVTCEPFDKVAKGATKFCVVNESAVIDAKEFQISSKIGATGLRIKPNWNISHLPIKIGKVFPRLKTFEASACLITKISEEHFEGLGKLSDINLTSNRIEEVSAAAFKDLAFLKSLDLSE